LRAVAAAASGRTAVAPIPAGTLGVVIGLLGATGYTGRLTAAALHDAGLPHRRGARSAERLAALPPSPHATDVVVDTTDPAGLDAFLDGCDAVISTVGPFTSLGKPVVEAAVRTRTPYVDSTGEPGFMQWVYANHAGAPVPVVPACGFDYVPGDLAVALAQADLAAAGGGATEVLVGYRLRGSTVTRGTARSAVEALASGAMTWRPSPVELPFAEGGRPGVVIPWGEDVTVDRRAPGLRVRCAIEVPGVSARALGLARPVVQHGQPILRVMRPMIDAMTERMPEGPSPEVRAAARFTIVAAATGADGSRARVQVSGRDVYGLTADLLVACARRLGDAPPGARTPAEAFAAAEVLDAVPVDWRRLKD
jgi:short subunit dehydrogenase-like uncharacterized protein